MTNGILKSIKEKDILYKNLVNANIDDKIAYANLQAEFTNYTRKYGPISLLQSLFKIGVKYF